MQEPRSVGMRRIALLKFFGRSGQTYTRPWMAQVVVSTAGVYLVLALVASLLVADIPGRPTSTVSALA